MSLILLLEFDKDQYSRTPEQKLYCNVILRAIEDIKYYMTVKVRPERTPKFLINYKENAYCSKSAINVYEKLKEKAKDNKIKDFSSAEFAKELRLTASKLRFKLSELENQGVIYSEYVLRPDFYLVHKSMYVRNIFFSGIIIHEIAKEKEAQQFYAMTETDFLHAMKYLFCFQTDPYYSLIEHLNYVLIDDVKTEFALNRIRQACAYYLKLDDRVLQYFKKKYPRTLSDSLIENSIKPLI